MKHSWPPRDENDYLIDDTDLKDRFVDAMKLLDSVGTGGSEEVDTHIIIAQQHLRLAIIEFEKRSSFPVKSKGLTYKRIIHRKY